jgi:hypothetical protein
MKVFKLCGHQKDYSKGIDMSFTLILISIKVKNTYLSIVLLDNYNNNYYWISDELIISQKDYPTLKIGDVIEIYAPEDDFRYFSFTLNYQ